MHVVVPFAATDPKTRLASVLTSTERSTFARAMLADVLTAIVEADAEPTVVSTAPLDPAALSLEGRLLDAVSVAVDDRPLTEAVNARLPADHDEAATAVVMADLALATPEALERLFSHDTGVAIAPGRSGGTNAVVVSHPDFRVDYHGASYLDHCEIARDVDTHLETIDSFRLSTDIDEPEDLAEVLVHGADTDRAPACLREFGFALETRDGRVGVARLEESTRE